jgi:hypothetical protein
VYRGIHVLNYTLAVSMIVVGVLVILSKATAVVFSTKLALILFGLTFIVSGWLLLISCVKKRRTSTKTSLFVVYLASLFSAWLQFVIVPHEIWWVISLVFAAVAAGLWLWWKFHTEYFDIRRAGL